MIYVLLIMEVMPNIDKRDLSTAKDCLRHSRRVLACLDTLSAGASLDKAIILQLAAAHLQQVVDLLDESETAKA